MYCIFINSNRLLAQSSSQRVVQLMPKRWSTNCWIWTLVATVMMVLIILMIIIKVTVNKTSNILHYNMTSLVLCTHDSDATGAQQRNCGWGFTGNRITDIWTFDEFLVMTWHDIQLQHTCLMSHGTQCRPAGVITNKTLSLTLPDIALSGHVLTIDTRCTDEALLQSNHATTPLSLYPTYNWPPGCISIHDTVGVLRTRAILLVSLIIPVDTGDTVDNAHPVRKSINDTRPSSEPMAKRCESSDDAAHVAIDNGTPDNVDTTLLHRVSIIVTLPSSDTIADSCSPYVIIIIIISRDTYPWRDIAWITSPWMNVIACSTVPQCSTTSISTNDTTTSVNVWYTTWIIRRIDDESITSGCPKTGIISSVWEC